ncbi:MAG: GNAT family N-acetyltransferase [Butyricicoccus sp.]|nr:GNAT family N-acetyltransferase [Butyricicoccus sp.]
MPDFSLLPLDAGSLPAFSQYLLPRASQAMRDNPAEAVAFGLTTGRYAAGAACAEVRGAEATVTSLFVDPAARGHGGAGLLLDALIAPCRERGAQTLYAEYSLSGSDLAAMDALFRAKGAVVQSQEDESFRMDSALFHDAPLIRAALQPSFRPAAAVQKFSSLSPEQLENLSANPDVPDFLNWSAYTGRADPDWSLAWVENGRVLAFTLACASADGGCTQLSTVRTPAASPSSVLALIRALVNLAYYRLGGDFPFYTSTMAPESRALVERLAKGRYTLFACHQAVLSFT